jgi:hypothetical protein
LVPEINAFTFLYSTVCDNSAIYITFQVFTLEKIIMKGVNERDDLFFAKGSRDIN